MNLYGAGGHAKVICDILLANGIAVDKIVDDNSEIRALASIPVVHTATPGSEMIVSIGSNLARQAVVRRLEMLGVRFATAIHPSAIVSPHASIGEGSVVMAGAIVNSGAVVGRHCIVNSGAVVEHDCRLGDFVHVSPHATLCGGVTVGEGSWIGAGSVVRQETEVGQWTTVGAGAVVVSHLPDHVTAYGNPCRVRNSR